MLAFSPFFSNDVLLILGQEKRINRCEENIEELDYRVNELETNKGKFYCYIRKRLVSSMRDNEID